MKTLIFLLAFALPALSNAQQRAFHLQVVIDESDPKSKVYLQYDNDEGNTVLDSAFLKDKVFDFKGKISSPIEARISFDQEKTTLSAKRRKSLSFYLDQGKMTITVKNPSGNASVLGDQISENLALYRRAIASTNEVLKELMMERWNKGVELTDSLAKNLEMKFAAANEGKLKIQKGFILASPKSYSSLLILMKFWNEFKDPIKAEPLFLALSSDLRKSKTGLTLGENIAIKKTTVVGAIAPDFTQNDINGKPVKLSDFRGKYVLLEFWASWCPPCRGESPNLVAAYNKYKDKNFTIVGVSHDDLSYKQKWLDAIANDNLTWTQLNGFQARNNPVSKMYSVEKIPMNFLIDPQGKIIAVKLMGKALHEKLEEVLK